MLQTMEFSGERSARKTRLVGKAREEARCDELHITTDLLRRQDALGHRSTLQLGLFGPRRPV